MSETKTPSQTTTGLNEKLNQLRAGVMGANDGIVSTAAVVVGVAGATSDVRSIATAGIAAVIGGAVSMALGEYVSVSSQRDSEEALIEKEQKLHAEDPEGEFEVLVQEYIAKGISEETAHQVATEVTEHDALEAHLDMHYGIDAVMSSARGRQASRRSSPSSSARSCLWRRSCFLQRAGGCRSRSWSQSPLWRSPG